MSDIRTDVDSHIVSIINIIEKNKHITEQLRELFLLMKKEDKDLSYLETCANSYKTCDASSKRLTDEIKRFLTTVFNNQTWDNNTKLSRKEKKIILQNLHRDLWELYLTERALDKSYQEGPEYKAIRSTRSEFDLAS